MRQSNSPATTDADAVLRAVVRGSKKSDIILDAEVAVQLARRVEFSSLVLSSVESQLDPVLGSASGARSNVKASQLASVVRKQCKVDELSPIFSLASALEKYLGILVFPIDSPDISGGCAVNKNTAYIFSQHDDNANFLLSCAHQVAHLLTMAESQRRGPWFSFCKSHSKMGQKRGPRENFADTFARELLVPQQGLVTALREVRKQLRVSADTLGDVELLYVSRIFGVNFLAVGKRCERIGLLPSGGAMSLQRFLEKKCGSPEKRANQLDLPDRPSIQLNEVPAALSSLTRRLITERKVSADQAANALGISVKLLSGVKLH